MPIAPGASFGSSGEIAPSPPGGSLFSRIFSRPASSPIPPGFGTSNLGAPPYGGPNYGAETYGAPTYGAPVYGNGHTNSRRRSRYCQRLRSSAQHTAHRTVRNSQAASIRHESLGAVSRAVCSKAVCFRAEALRGSAGYDAFRLFQGPRFSQILSVAGTNQLHLQVNNTDVSLVFAFPNFLYWRTPLFVIPSFSLQLWDGPDGSTGADLPPSAYSGVPRYRLGIGPEPDV